MKTIKYNGKDLIIGSIAEASETIIKHMNVLDKRDVREQDEVWHSKFNCQVNEIENFLSLTENKKCLLDIGSQFGIFSFSFLGNDTNKKAYAFDGGITPFLVTSQIRLLNNLTNFNNFNFFIGDKDEQIKCYSESFQSLAIPGNDTRLMLTIDTICAMYNIEPDAIKIDIEGSEGNALIGAKDAITNYKPIIFIEIHPQFLLSYNWNIEKIVDFVKTIDYDVYDLQGNKIENYLEILKQEKTDSNRTVWKPKNN
jgi:FkbM family methyltransferase